MNPCPRPAVLAPSLAVLLLGAAASAQEGPTPDEIMQAWLASPHADAEADAFAHWNDEGEVPATCAVCHSGEGFLAYAAGDAAGPALLTHPVPVGSVVGCDTCHSEAAQSLPSVVFPSGVAVEGLGRSKVCAVCHQGRAATDTVNATLEGMRPDEASADLTFLNVHYRAAAATLLGGEVRGGYQYQGQEYAGRFAHPAPADDCAGCHDPHRLDVATEVCTTCHKEADGPRAIRTRETDVDGDGDTAEGVAGEIATLQDRLLAAIGTYADAVAGKPIVYAADRYPYFFVDTDRSGTADATETALPNRYNAWTPRLLQAAYNFQFVEKDPGAYAHNPGYTMQLLIDSLQSLGEAVEIETDDLTRP